MNKSRTHDLLQALIFAAALTASTSLPANSTADDSCVRPGCLGCVAGCPPRVGIVSAPSNTRHYGGYYVGGGTIFPGGQTRFVNEGTWGWDYGGLLNHKWVVLDYSHGRRYQAGGGPYRTAGPAPHLSQ